MCPEPLRRSHFPGKPRGPLGQIYPLQARRRPGRVSIRRISPYLLDFLLLVCILSLIFNVPLHPTCTLGLTGQSLFLFLFLFSHVYFRAFYHCLLHFLITYLMFFYVLSIPFSSMKCVLMFHRFWDGFWSHFWCLFWYLFRSRPQPAKPSKPLFS